MKILNSVKRSIMIAAIFLLSIAVSGCTEVQSAAPSEQESTVSNENSIVGKVSRVDGNILTLELGTMKKMDFSSENGAPENAESTEAEKSDTMSRGERGAKGSGERQRPSGDTASGDLQSPQGGFEPPSGDIPSGELQPPSGGSMPAMGGSGIELTGETKEVEVPIGTPVYMMMSGDDKTDVGLTKIAKDAVVKINMNDKEKILSVTVMG